MDGKGHRYCSYAQGARFYRLPYTTFIRIAKEAGANFKVSKSAVVDLDIFEAYIEENFSVEYEPKGEIDMPTRKKIESLKLLVQEGRKKYIRIEEGAELYSVGRNTFRELAKEADAVRKVKGVVLINVKKVDDFIESFGEDGFRK